MSESPVAERVTAVVDLGAVERNCAALESRLEGGADLCAVVKADGYGHGAAACAAAALRGGASWLAVATADEAEELRMHFGEVPILVLGALTEAELRRSLAIGAEVAAWSPRFAALASGIAASMGEGARLHLKHDSGMGRLGERDPDRVVALAQSVAGDDRLALAGIWTHFATADESGDEFFGRQLEAFRAVVERVREVEPSVRVHAANSAATLRDPACHFDMVRCGVAIYGLDPFQQDPAAAGLAPALEWRSYLAEVKRFEAGASAGYGRTWRARGETWVGVIPVGYGDGYRRALSNAAEVLIGGRRHPVVGTISMDNLTVDLGPEPVVERGAPAVLLGRQGTEAISAEELARRLGTINYEVTCAISSRVPRAHPA